MMPIEEPRAEGKMLWRGGKMIARFDFPIEALLSFPKAIVVILDIPFKVSYPRNVFGVGLDGTILWQAPDSSIPAFDSNVPYLRIARRGGCVEVVHQTGIVLVLDPETGREVDRGYTK